MLSEVQCMYMYTVIILIQKQSYFSRSLSLMREACVTLTVLSEVDVPIYFQDLSNLTSNYYKCLKYIFYHLCHGS